MTKYKFDIGDKVKILKCGFDYLSYTIGMTGIVTEISRCPYILLENGEMWAYRQEHLELVKEEVPEGIEIVYKIGDKEFNTLEDAKTGLKTKKSLSRLENIIDKQWAHIEPNEIGKFLNQNKMLVLEYYGVDND